MKKIMLLLMACVLSLGLVACGANPTGATAQNKEAQEAAQAINHNGKVLVVYFSGTGNTKRVATDIAKATNADVLELQPVQPYSKEDLDYHNKESRVMKEMDNKALRDIPLVKDQPDNWSQYDTVFVGYPIWRHNAAWPIDNFIKHNDFTGKTVIPFATSVDSGIGESGKLLQQMAGTGNWLPGHRFASGASASEVQEWVKSLGF